jgi:hypothetical protein
MTWLRNSTVVSAKLHLCRRAKYMFFRRVFKTTVRLSVFGGVLGEYQDVIQEDDNKLIQVLVEHIVHSSLEWRRGVGKIEGHDAKLIMPIACLERCLVNPFKITVCVIRTFRRSGMVRFFSWDSMLWISGWWTVRIDVFTNSTCFCTIIGCFLRLNFIWPGCTGTTLIRVGTTCLLMAFNRDLGEVVSMGGDTLFRLVEDGGSVGTVR